MKNQGKHTKKRIRRSDIYKHSLLTDDNKKLMRRIFHPTVKSLPKFSDMSHVLLDLFDSSMGIPFEQRMAGYMQGHMFREVYVQKMFVACTDEFMRSLSSFIVEHKKFEHVAELASGTGWFSKWMKKYGIPVDHTVDNKSWKFKRYLPIVEKMDAVQFVKEHPEIQLFILSWPYMNDMAADIWDAMKPGQYLLYIGEGRGGCTANDRFFQETWKSEIENDKVFNLTCKFYKPFPSLHDHPRLYYKGAKRKKK